MLLGTPTVTPEYDHVGREARRDVEDDRHEGARRDGRFDRKGAGQTPHELAQAVVDGAAGRMPIAMHGLPLPGARQSGCDRGDVVMEHEPCAEARAELARQLDL